ncbi:Conidiation-specific protein 13 [Hypsizygus marmoreus]|uniref:Conidiation-specific protein 13 n=1 Tax=Hypsizygus marmoreus TaxID=39966 RepID=A0A369K1U0_HYPMA|nr:Conidiation-specific protein 13 [Hypsizygus marmoreus]
MALSQHKLVFFATLFSSFLIHHLGSAAPLRARPRRSTGDPAPAATPTPLTLKAQQDSFDFDLASSLVLPSSTMTTLETVPTNCAVYNSLESECPTFFVASNVTYDDCGDAFTVCRCSDATMSMDVVVDRLGRVPVGLRRYVGTVIVSADDKPHAYTLTSGDIHMFGDTAVDTWVHEAGHAFDWASGSPHSGSPEWQKAIDSDTCVPDTYSTTSAGEDFAQMTVLKVYSLINNTLPEGWTSDCMQNQLDYMNSLALFNKAELFGNTCAIQGSDHWAKHTTPPPTLSPMPLLPDPAQVEPDSPLESSITVPDINQASNKKLGNGALSTTMENWRLMLLVVGVLAAWLSW